MTGSSAPDGPVHLSPWSVLRGTVHLLVTPDGEEIVCKAESIAPPRSGDWFGAGTGWGTYGEILSTKFGERLKGFAGERLPDARDVLKLAIREFSAGRTASAEEAIPVYLRHPVQGTATNR